MSKFKPLDMQDSGAHVQKICIGAPGGPMLEVQKDAAGEKELGLSGQVERPNSDGEVRELARRLAQIYRRVASNDPGSHTLTQDERRAIRDRIVEAMTAEGIKPTEELRAIASLLAGLRDELPIETAGDVKKSANFTSTTCPHCNKTSVIEVPGATKGRLPEIRCPNCSKAWQEDLSLSKRSDGASPELRALMADTRAKLEVLRRRITKLLDDRAASAHPRASKDDDLAQAELRKALANGKPARFDGEGIKKSGFQPIQSIAPGVRIAVSDLPAGPAVKRGGKFQPQQS